MPLIKGKSEKSFKKNVETKIEAGRPQKQALAIAYSIKRAMEQKKALGGKVEHLGKKMAEYHQRDDEMSSHRDREGMFMAEGGEVCAHCGKMADGGVVGERIGEEESDTSKAFRSIRGAFGESSKDSDASFHEQNRLAKDEEVDDDEEDKKAFGGKIGDSIADRIREKKKRQMADGGVVDKKKKDALPEIKKEATPEEWIAADKPNRMKLLQDLKKTIISIDKMKRR